MALRCSTVSRRESYSCCVRPDRLTRAGGWPEPAPEARPVSRAIIETAPLLERILTQNVVPFWRERAVDDVCQADGDPHPTADRLVVPLDDAIDEVMVCGDGVIVERARTDFPSLLMNCALSISQGGYNTVM